MCGFVYCVSNVKYTVRNVHNTHNRCAPVHTWCARVYLCIVKIVFVSTMDGKNARMYMRYVKSDDDITTVCGLLFIEFLCCGLIPSVTLSSIAMNMVKVFCVVPIHIHTILETKTQEPISQSTEK